MRQESVFPPVQPRKTALALTGPEHLACMYLLTIRDGLQTRHIGPYASPKQAADQLDALLARCGERARWQIHALESPATAVESTRQGPARPTAVAA